MSKKRFDYTHYDDGTESIYDRKKDEYYFDCEFCKLDEVLNELEEENEELKQFIHDLCTKGTGRIDLANGYAYNVKAILSDWKGDVE